MSFTAPKPGGWAFGEVLASTQMNDFNTDHPNAVDGGAGGTYAPSSVLTLGGSGLTMTGQFTGPNYAALYAVSGSAVADGSKFTLAQTHAGSGYSLSSDEVQVPAAGKYLVGLTINATHSSASNPSTLIATVVKGAATQTDAQDTRYSTTTSQELQGTSLIVLDVATPASEKLSVKNASGSNVTVVTGTLSIARMI